MFIDRLFSKMYWIRNIINYLIWVLIIGPPNVQSSILHHPSHIHTNKDNLDLILDNETWTENGWEMIKIPELSIEPAFNTNGKSNSTIKPKIIPIPSGTVSLLSSVDLTIFLQSSAKKTYHLNLQANTRFTLISKNHALDVYKNGSLVLSRALKEKKIANVTVKSKQEITLKTHYGYYITGTKVSKNDSTKLVQLDEPLCMIIETDLCKTCYLEVFRSGDAILNMTSHTSLEKHKLQFEKGDTIMLHRKTINMADEGFWGLIIKACESDLVPDVPEPERNSIITITIISVGILFFIFIIYIIYIKRANIIEHFDVRYDSTVSVRTNEEEQTLNG